MPINNKTKPELLIKCERDELVDEEHFGFIVLSNKNKAFDFTGETNNYPFYLRSCAKPLQASLVIDYEMDKFYDMTDEEIAICCASHTGEEIHVNTARKLLNKIGLDESYLKCGLHKPLSKTEQSKMLLNSTPVNILHNNCSGKHIMMLGLCKMKNWDIETYYLPEHPLQKAIKTKIYDLCKVQKNYPVTTDGCGVPIVSMPLTNMLQGYLNLFTNPKYERIKNAFLKHPYIIGGEDRTDTKIIEHSDGIIAKVGAGGLCVVVNSKTEEAFVVKISDCDMKARELVVIQVLKNLHWADIEIDTDVKTINGKIVGKIKILSK